MMSEERAGTADANAPDPGCDPVVKAIDNLNLGLLETAKEIRASQQILSASFGDITARFAQVHGIAVAGEGQGTAPNRTLIALRRVVDALAVELQVEDSLNQLLGRALGRIESISRALNQTRSLAEGACSTQDEAKRGEHVLAALGHTLESLRNAERPGGGPRFDAGPGSVDLF